MTKILSGLIALLMSGSVSAVAAKPTQLTLDVLTPYLKIQENLANDSMEGVPTAASEIAKATKDKDLKTSAQKLSQDRTIDQARKHFKEVSKVVDQWAKVEKTQGIDRMTCLMANASWLQKQGSVKNPYYGAQMQSCGEVQK